MENKTNKFSKIKKTDIYTETDIYETIKLDLINFYFYFY